MLVASRGSCMALRPRTVRDFGAMYYPIRPDPRHVARERRDTPHNPNQLVAANLVALHDKKTQLRKEISALAILGAQVVTTSFIVGKDRAGKDIVKTKSQPRGLNAEERARVLTMRKEIDDIDKTLRLLGQ